MDDDVSARLELEIPGNRHVALDVLFQHLALACTGASLYGYADLLVDKAGCVYIDGTMIYEPKQAPNDARAHEWRIGGKYGH